MKKIKYFLLLTLVCALAVTACGKKGGDSEKTDPEDENAVNIIDDNYRNYYEIFLYSFCDSNGDGIGDIQGLISKLDYINDGDPNTETDLECNGIWLMPYNPSTTYHKYDVTNYLDIDPQYGTLDDFKQLVEECHKRGINLVMDFVMNHTSVQHEWFKEASAYLATLKEGEVPDASKCKYVDYYNFVEGKPATGVYSKVPGTLNWFYECKFWSGMPDLDLFNENVRKEFEEYAKFWMDLGVDGFRLDAAKEYESDNDPKNIEILKWFSGYVKGYKENAYIVAEVYSGIGQYAKYLSSGIDSVFDFGMATGNGFVATTINGMLSDTSAANFGKNLKATIDTELEYNENYIMAPFIGNHDVDRIAAAFGFMPEKVKMGIGMLEIMPGSTFLYYGDELGIGGTGKDENKRAPIHWSATDTSKDCKGPGAMEADKVQYKFATAEEQVKDPESIFNYTRKVIRLRNKYPQIARGTLELIETDNTYVCAMKRTYEDKQIIIVMNPKNKEQKVDISKSDNGYKSLKETVAAKSTDAATLDGDTLTLPPYSIAILK